MRESATCEIDITQHAVESSNNARETSRAIIFRRRLHCKVLSDIRGFARHAGKLDVLHHGQVQLCMICCETRWAKLMIHDAHMHAVLLEEEWRIMTCTCVHMHHLVTITISKQCIIERVRTLQAKYHISLSTLGPHLHMMLGLVICLTLRCQVGYLETLRQRVTSLFRKDISGRPAAHLFQRYSNKRHRYKGPQCNPWCTGSRLYTLL